jgi:Reverse transcriptase (RNA-dependent DNA polymerase)
MRFVKNLISCLNISMPECFDKLQSGFRKMHSIATILLKIAEDLRLSIYKGDAILMVFLDYSKPFDLVDHALLLKKLRKVNRSEPAILFFKSSLENNHISTFKTCNQTYGKL